MLPKPGKMVHQQQMIEQMEENKFGLQQLVNRYKRRTAFSFWIRDNICKKECCFFDKDVSREDVCKCGYPKTHHVDEAIKPENNTGESWDKFKHVRGLPTDAFGDIQFGGLAQRTSKYARVAADTKPEVLYRLLTDQWKLSPPNLLISVTGGARNFHLKAHLKSMFHRGLIKVAQTTGAWIITGGTNVGVMKHVGKAVRDYSLSNSSMQGQIVAIGMASWGVIHNRDTLVSSEGHFPAQYFLDSSGQGRLSCLDNNHTHFLLVDDGTHGHYGVEIDLRSRLERFISRRHLGNTESSMTIPVVCVVLDGGPGTLKTMYNGMMNGTPCVVLEGSGRIADVIAQVAGLPVAQVTIAHVRQLMEKFFGQEYDTFPDLDILKWTKMIQDIIRMSHLLTVFRVSVDNHGEMDVAILQALFKGRNMVSINDTSPTGLLAYNTALKAKPASRAKGSLGAEHWKRQLELAIAWNRVDIAKTEIFTEESQWRSTDLHWAMFSALVGNKPQFVSLLLENGVSLSHLLQDEQTLCELYKQLPSCFFLHKLAKRVHGAHLSRKKKFSIGARVHSGQGDQLSLSHVSDEVRHLLGSFTQHLYPTSSMTHHLNTAMEDKSVSMSKNQAPLRDHDAESHMDSGRDLFLWAVVQNNRELSEIFWEQCKDCICAALAASKILKKMSEEGIDADEAEEMQQLSNHYEKHAIGVFTECHNSDEERAQKLLVRESPFWGRTTCLKLALESDDKNFVAHTGVQALLTQTWCGQLSVYNSVWRVVVCIVFFPFIYTGFLLFRHDEAIQRETEKSEQKKTVETVTGSTLRTNPHSHKPARQQHLKPLSKWSRLVSLYSSPQVKFYLNVVSYFAFLLLFAVVLMIDFQPTPSPGELLLYVWLLSLVLEELRQLFHDPDGFGFQKKAKMYINDLWNILDVLCIVLFVIGVIFRFISELFYAGKILLCIDFVVFCLRLMAIFTISRTLGPKIIIVKRMMMDMFFFMFLLSIWVVAYGVSKQGILIQNDDRLDWILRGAVYHPYLSIFGNFPTDIDKSTFDISSCTVNGSDPLKPKCPVLDENQTPVFPEWLTIIMLCVYLLFANILLLNLLIAIFNFTFQEVQDNTDRIWKFQRYELIKEYYSRPALPPPFCIVIYVYFFVRKMVLCRSPTMSMEFKNKLPQIEEEELLSWEALMKDRYLLALQTEQSQNMERYILDTAQKVNTITDHLERQDERLSAAMVQRLARLEEQVIQSTKSIQWIVDSLKSQGRAAKDAPSTTSIKTEDASDASKKKDGFHVNARQLHYPDTNLTRFPVPEEKVSWEVKFSSYMPTYYSEDGSGDSVDGSESEAKYNYRNPGGRTGIRGKGALRHLGPNQSLDLVVTRWRDSTKAVLEFLAVWDEKDGVWTLPGESAQSANPQHATVQDATRKTVYEKINKKVSERTKVFEGYVDDSRNTDDAWVETTVVNIHLDTTHRVMVNINSMMAKSNGSLQWQEVSSKTRLSSNQRDSLQQVAELCRKF